jgi:hypothetical protein
MQRISVCERAAADELDRFGQAPVHSVVVASSSVGYTREP